MDLRSSAAELGGDVLGQPLGIAARYIHVKVLICFQFIQHIIDRDLDSAVLLIHHFRGKLRLIDEQIELFVLLFPD